MKLWMYAVILLETSAEGKAPEAAAMFSKGQAFAKLMAECKDRAGKDFLLNSGCSLYGMECLNKISSVSIVDVNTCATAGIKKSREIEAAERSFESAKERLEKIDPENEMLVCP